MSSHTLYFIYSLTFSPEAEAPLRCRDLSIFISVTRVKEGSDADLVLVQVNSSQLSLVQIQVTVGIQLREHPANGVLAAGYQAPVQRCWKYSFFCLHYIVFAKTTEL